MFDPCGTRKLEGEEILKRLAEYLGVELIRLKQALVVIAKSENTKTIYEHTEIVK
jgi:hypothetical protein